MSLALRPRFELEVAAAGREVLARLADELGRGPMSLRRTRPPGGGPQGGPRDADHLVLTVRDDARHVWSPWLTLDVAPRGQGAAIHGSFSPHPSVWTGFMFGYLTAGVSLVLSLTLAGALALTGGSPWALWLAGGAALALVGLWWASRVGQRRAAAQMAALRGELDRALAAAGLGAPPA